MKENETEVGRLKGKKKRNVETERWKVGHVKLSPKKAKKIHEKKKDSDMKTKRKT